MSPVMTMTNKMQRCIDACMKCAQACNECFKACLNEADVGARARCISTLVDCAELCQMSAAYMTRDSQFAQAICGMCADVCERCAQECAMFKDSHCQECAQICRDCAAECRKMAGM